MTSLAHLFPPPGACLTLVVDSENRPRRGRFLPDSPPHGCSMGQEAGKKGAGGVDLQPTIPKSDRLLVPHIAYGGVCPCCSGAVYRVQRRSFDRFVNFFMPVHRYRCGSLGCSWEGNLLVRRESPLK